ncbi:hypothetical protein [Caviibacterium pharyngocola]|uniref:Outer membrane antigenic lipoprotein B n=1 Tax=Caviibacterium pharyngocola TaxID=28159 RepID=A0A2M8RY99_9PAST|nr:hypothetical protein [Caviibacterium pharyngocola]PJG83869.1 hypothetical protein CVP04_01910 [Caviibacterium pharyngocola]
MNKLLLLLSMILALSACSSNDEIIDENTLAPGIMQPVEGTGAVAGSEWLPEIEKQKMPENMN